jgi:hypothetical protein
MPYADFSEKISFSSNLFVRIKEKGDKLQFRIIDRPYYDGKHFLKNPDGTWNVIPCPRINKTGDCSYCKEFFRIKALAAKASDDKEKKLLEKQARNVSVAISFYYPVINRASEALQIFQTTMGVRSKIEAEIELGTKVLTTDFVILNTGEVGRDRYALSKVDSADTKDLTDKELAVVEKYQQMNLAELISGTPDDDSGVAAEANSEVVEDIDL